MKLFNTLCLEINARCNRSCAWCPVAYNTRPDEIMPPDLVFKAFMELGEIEYSGRIELYIYNEPLKDMGRALHTLARARAVVPRACLMIATNGDYIKSASDINRLYDIGLNQLLINCYSPGLYEKRLKWIEELPADVSRTLGVYNNSGPRKRVIQMLDKSNPETFGSGVFRMLNRAGNIPDFLPPLDKPVSRMCVKPFRLLNINWRGEALVCCQDYHGDVAYGNLTDNTLVELWEHPVMNEYRARLLAKDRSLPLCNACDCYAGAYPHNVPQPTGARAGAKAVQSLYAGRQAARAGVVALGGARKKPRTGKPGGA